MQMPYLCCHAGEDSKEGAMAGVGLARVGMAARGKEGVAVGATFC